MSWRGLEGAVAAAKQGHDTVLAPGPALYFDHRQSTSPDEPPGRGKLSTLKSVYAFNAEPSELTPEQHKHVLGMQATMFSEHIRTDERAVTMLFPRLAALATWLTAFDAAAGADPATLQAAIAANKRDFDARFALAQVHLAGQRFTEAMDERGDLFGETAL